MPTPGEYGYAKSVGVLYNSTEIYQWAGGRPFDCMLFSIGSDAGDTQANQLITCKLRISSPFTHDLFNIFKRQAFPGWHGPCIRK